VEYSRRIQGRRKKGLCRIDAADIQDWLEYNDIIRALKVYALQEEL
jgi:hypothetical protein